MIFAMQPYRGAPAMPMVTVEHGSFCAYDMFDAMDGLYESIGAHCGAIIRDVTISTLLRNEGVISTPTGAGRYRIADIDRYIEFFDAFIQDYCRWRVAVANNTTSGAEYMYANI